MKTLLILNVIGGICRPMSVVYSPDCYRVLDKIIVKQNEYNNLIICNDDHSIVNQEFRFLPEHATTPPDRSIISYFVTRLAKRYEHLTKNTLSAVKKPHNYSIISSSREIHIVGFNLSLDIIPTALDLIQDGISVQIETELCGDLTEDRRLKSLEYLQFLGVPLVNS
jgi:hypothetical protein